MLVEKLIGKQLKKHREKEKELTITRISRRLGVSDRTVSRIESGSMHLSDINRLIKICNAYNTNLLEIKQEAEADFVLNYSCLNALTPDELDRYRNTFEELNKAILKQIQENEKESNNMLLEVITKKFEDHKIYGRFEEKEDLTELINALIDTKIKQIKRNK